MKEENNERKYRKEKNDKKKEELKCEDSIFEEDERMRPLHFINSF